MACNQRGDKEIGNKFKFKVNRPHLGTLRKLVASRLLVLGIRPNTDSFWRGSPEKNGKPPFK